MDPRLVLAPRAPDPAGRAALVARGRRHGCRRFALPAGEGGAATPDETVLEFDGGTLATGPGSGSRQEVVPVDSPESLARALASGSPERPLVLRWTAERLIPLENALAGRAPGRPVWVVTDRPREVPGALGALESGADAVVVELRDAAVLEELLGLMEPAVEVTLSWELVRIRRVEPAGLGDRVIVDTTSILDPAEGLLVGSAAAFLFHVPSEAEGSRFTGPRAFRVNAGSAHSYVLRPDGTTRYLAELAPGDAVLVARAGAREGARAVRVGRLKIERRPLVLVEAEREGRAFTVFLQEAETVRLSGASARRPTTAVAAGETVYGVSLPAARHLGRAVEESIDER